MHLKKVTLRSFRCFEKLELDLHPRLTVLVAENGGGKTSVLDGIALGLAPLLRNLSSANQRLSAPTFKDTDFRLESWEGRGGEERWGKADYTQVIVETTSGLKWDHAKSATKGKHPEEKVPHADLNAHTAKLLESIKTATPDLMPVIGYYGAKRGWIKIPERLRGARGDYSHPAAALVGALNSTADFGEMVNWFDSEEVSEMRSNKGHHPEDYTQSPALAAVRETVSTLLGGAYNFPQFNKRHKFVVKSNTGPDEIQVSQLSQGYQSMLALGMDFSRRLALANPTLSQSFPYFEEESPTGPWKLIFDYIRQHGMVEVDMVHTERAAPAIMLVDEIDLHLHPSWQQRVLPDLMRAFPGTQFIVTTHSPQVLTTVPKECIRILSCDENGLGSAIEPVEQTKGVESATVLAEVMNVDPLPKMDEVTKLHRYHALIQQALDSSDEGVRLRAELNAHFGETSQVMRECDRIRRLEAFKRTLPTLPPKTDGEANTTPNY